MIRENEKFHIWSEHSSVFIACSHVNSKYMLQRKEEFYHCGIDKLVIYNRKYSRDLKLYIQSKKKLHISEHNLMEKLENHDANPAQRHVTSADYEDVEYSID